MKILFLSVTPSPYQRDFFRSLSHTFRVKLTVCYFEGMPDDTPWDTVELEAWESILPGRVFGHGRVRCHWNSQIPNLGDYERVIINAPITAATTQLVFRLLLKSEALPWYFWGEQLISHNGVRGVVQKILSQPLRRARKIVAIGRNAQLDYLSRFPTRPVENIPYACDLRVFLNAAKCRKTTNTCRFLFAGQMIERKGVDILLVAFAGLIESGVEAVLHLVGREGELQSWLSQMSQRVQDRVHYHGFEQPAALPTRFASADVFVLPSRHDGWGVVVNQAFGAGMPVISSTAAGAGHDLVKNGVNGLHVRPGDIVSLESAMFQLATCRELRDQMSAAAFNTAERLGPDVAARRWIELLTE